MYTDLYRHVSGSFASLRATRSWLCRDLSKEAMTSIDTQLFVMVMYVPGITGKLPLADCALPTVVGGI
jgi:hypothetical protein